MNKTLLVTMACIIPFATVHAAEHIVVSGGNAKAQGIIDKKCTSCHSKDKVEKALSSGQDMAKIQKQMEKRGVKLSASEQEVLGIFWKQSKPITKK